MALFTKKDDVEEKKQQQAAEIKRGVPSSASLLSTEAVVRPKVEVPEITNARKLTNDVKFSDLYITPDKTCYIWGGKKHSGLVVANFMDLAEFTQFVIDKFDGLNSSYSLQYKGRNYRIERTIALEGEQYCVRKMPTSIPDLERLGFSKGVFKQLCSLATRNGLILFSGATGAGKSTSCAALLKKYLQVEGGYAFTIEDPIEMPLDGIYKTQYGDIGLCKQTTPPGGLWEEGLKSALRSKPKYIYLGEIRSPEAAVELLRAATSGHLVLSTIHANNVGDAINSLAKYAASSGISEDMSYELMANGLLGCVYQSLEGSPRRLKTETIFTNPEINKGCAVRGMLRTGSLNLATMLETQRVKLEKGMPLFDEIK